jgi:hypothetical protein
MPELRDAGMLELRDAGITNNAGIEAPVKSAYG